MSLKNLIRTPKKQNSCNARVNSAPKTARSKQANPFVKDHGQLQCYLKQNFCNSAKRQKQPTYQRVWRKTIVLTKPKPKIRLPKLFRADRRTGLPVDYERTVSNIMHYVNPQLSTSSSPEKQMEKLLTRKLPGFTDCWNCNNHCSQVIRNPMPRILKRQGSTTSKNVRRIVNEELCQFHSACKRGPVVPELHAPTYKSKFNYNSLNINTQ